MPTIQRILEKKGRTVISIGPDKTVLDAAQLMNNEHIGALVVCEGDRVIGIFTERDILLRIVADQKDPAATLVRDVMTSKVACATSSSTTDELRDLMRNKRIRHVPVVDDGNLVGMLSIGDLNYAREEVQDETIQYLEQFMYRP